MLRMALLCRMPLINRIPRVLPRGRSQAVSVPSAWRNWPPLQIHPLHWGLFFGGGQEKQRPPELTRGLERLFCTWQIAQIERGLADSV